MRIYEDKYKISEKVLEDLYIDKNLNQEKISEILNIPRRIVGRRLAKLNIKKNPKYSNLEGLRYGRLVIKARAGSHENGGRLWLCVCDCGNEKRVTTDLLNNGGTKSCGCLQKEIASSKRGKNHSLFTGFEEISGYFWAQILGGAKKRSILVNITPKDAWELYLKQDKKCALSGVELKFDSQTHKYDGNASLDRIDSLKNYTIDNVQWIHKEINPMKMSMDNQKFINWCIKISDYQKNV